MKYKIYVLPGPTYKSIGYDDQNIYFSTLQISSIESIREYAENPKKRNTVLAHISSFEKMVLNHERYMVVLTSRDEKMKKQDREIHFDNPNSFAEFCEGFRNATALKTETVIKTGTRDFTNHYIRIAGIIIFFGVFIWFGRPDSGFQSSRALSSAIIELVRMITVPGVIGIGVAWILYILFKMWRKMQQPEEETQYTK